MDILFDINEQTLSRKSESEQPAEGSKNYLKCGFEFNTPEWENIVKVAVFKNEQGKEFNKYLGRGMYGECFVPFGALRGTDYFTITVYGGDLITTNEVIVTLMRSGYRRCSDGEQDIYVDILEELESKIGVAELNMIDEKVNNKIDILDFPACFDARMVLWCQDFIDGINQL